MYTGLSDSFGSQWERRFSTGALKNTATQEPGVVTRSHELPTAQDPWTKRRILGIGTTRMSGGPIFRVCYFGCLKLKGVSKSVQVLFDGIEAIFVLTLIILK